MLIDTGGNITHYQNYYLGGTMYDNANTAYYLKPSSTGTSLLVAGNIQLTAQSASWSEGLRINVPSSSTWGGIRITRGSGTGNWAIGYTALNSSDDLTFYGGTNNQIELNLDQSGNLVARGNITAYGSPSDIKLKENVKTLNNSLDKVLKLRGVSYDWKKETKEYDMVGLRSDVGFIANEVMEVVPELVRETDGVLSLRDKGIVALLVEAIKEQQKQIEELRDIINGKSK